MITLRVSSQGYKQHDNLHDHYLFYKQMFGSKDEQKSKQKKPRNEYIEESGCFQPLQFSDLKRQNRQVHALAKYEQDKKHRIVREGLNVEGLCTNQKCKVYNQMVWVNKGFGDFFVAQLIDDCNCPICTSKLPENTVRSLGYSRTKVHVVGKKQTDEKIEWYDQQTEGKLVRYPGYDGKTTRWKYLTITTTLL